MAIVFVISGQKFLQYEFAIQHPLQRKIQLPKRRTAHARENELKFWDEISMRGAVSASVLLIQGTGRVRESFAGASA
jgi:hypothetical protein